MKSLKETIITRDNLTAAEADILIMEAQEQLNYYLYLGDEDAAYNICEEYFGLEPDYLDDLL